MERTARPRLLGCEPRFPRIVGTGVLFVTLVTACALAQAKPAGSEPKTEPEAKSKADPGTKTEEKPKADAKTEGEKTSKGDFEAKKKASVTSSGDSDEKGKSKLQGQPATRERAKIKSAGRTRPSLQGQAGRRTAKHRKARPSFVMEPDAKWVCEKPVVTLEPVWRGNKRLTFDFDIRNDGTAPLRIKARGG